MEHEEYPQIYLYKRIVQAKLFIDNNYSKSIDLSNISNEACFSVFHFIRLFKTTYGKTPRQYLIKVRIDNSKLILVSGLSIAEVCEKVGFNSITTFSTLFKKMVGTTPLEFQKSCIKAAKSVASDPLLFVPACFSQANGWAKK